MYLDENGFDAHEARVCIATGRVLDDPKRPKDYSPEQYVKSSEQMSELFADVPEEDILMTIIETARENWWAAGRVVNPATGYDERMNDLLTGAEATS